MACERCSPDHVPTVIFAEMRLIEPLEIRNVEIPGMPSLANLTYRDRIIYLWDFVQRVVDGAMGEGSDKDAATIFHQKMRKVSEHEGLACAGWTLDQVEQVSRIRQCHSLDLALVELGVL